MMSALALNYFTMINNKSGRRKMEQAWQNVIVRAG